jgi:hypothetical protein
MNCSKIKKKKKKKKTSDLMELADGVKIRLARGTVYKSH